MSWRKKSKVILAMVLLVTVVMSSTSVVGATSQPTEKAASTKPSNQVNMYSLPTSKKADEVWKQLQQGKSPKELGLISAQQHAPKQKNLKEMEREAAQSKQTYPVKMNPSTQAPGEKWSSPPFDKVFENITFDECIDHLQGKGGKWIKNHYASCQIVTVKQDPLFPLQGPLLFRLTILGHGSYGERKVSYEYQIDDIKHGYEGIPGDTGWWENADISVDLLCNGTSNNPDCIGDQGPTTRSVSEWRENPRATEAFTSNEPPPTLENVERVSYMDIRPKVTLNPPGLFQPRSTEGFTQKVRADSADYMLRKKAAIFAEATPVFYYQESDPYFDIMDPAFEHHKQAMTDPQKTFPPREGKKIPGQSAPLTRLYPQLDPVQAGRNKYTKDIACADLRKTLPEDPRQKGEQCDEFPFASTYEGAGKGDGNFSVRYIPGDANNAHGRWLNAWYSYDRILHKDQFYIGFR
jgi:hypothetical protein